MNRTVIITGSSRGIGEATAAAFLKAGDKVVIFCRHQNHIEDATRRLRDLCPRENILPLVADVRNYRDVVRVVRQAVFQFGKIDILVNNAGIGLFKSVEETSEQEWIDVLDTNLKGYFFFLKEVVPLMKAQSSGIIINVSSELGESTSAKYSAYSASKFGVMALTESVADETKDKDIKIYAVLPGGVNTKLHLDMHPWEDGAKMMQPDYIGKKIFALADSQKPTGFKLKIYK